MKIIHLFLTALTSLGLNKARSSLTILGIVIGITAIILIVSIGQGAQNLVLGEIEGLGSELIVVRPGREPSGPTDFGESLYSDSLTQKDVEALRRKANVPYASAVAPAVVVPGSVSYLGETYRPQVLGWSAEFMSKIFNIYPEQGVLFGESESRSRSSVAIIGSKVKDELFGLENPLGKNIKIKDRSFRVVGVLPSRGQVAFFNIDDTVLVPETTAQTYLLGINHYHEIQVLAESTELVERTVLDIELTLREAHGITDAKKDDFYVVTQEGLVNQIGTILGVLTAFLSSVVAISLVVGGIGVMNIMLVSVTERTKEIGLRKALGATNRDILGQFLLEAVFLTGAGGLIGVFFGVILSFLASLALTKGLGVFWEFSFPWEAALIGAVVSAFVGLVFGIYPARQASQKSPIEALRYE